MPGCFQALLLFKQLQVKAALLCEVKLSLFASKQNFLDFLSGR